MKLSDVKIGMVALTKIGEPWCPVKVVGSFTTLGGVVRIRVERYPLPANARVNHLKPRSTQSLSPVCGVVNPATGGVCVASRGALSCTHDHVHLDGLTGLAFDGRKTVGVEDVVITYKGEPMLPGRVDQIIVRDGK